MIPTFTIVTTIITIGVTALLIAVLWRINDPLRQRSRADGGGDAPAFVASKGDRDGDGAGDTGSGGGDGGSGGE